MSSSGAPEYRKISFVVFLAGRDRETEARPDEDAKKVFDQRRNGSARRRSHAQIRTVDRMPAVTPPEGAGDATSASPAEMPF